MTGTMRKLDVLEGLDIGNGIAELERAILSEFFVESLAWLRLKNGKKDLVFGPKGSGKSALFFHLLEHDYEFSEKGIFLVSSENASGESVLSILSEQKLSTEDDYRRVWKLYFLVLLLDICQKNGIGDDFIASIKNLLEGEDLYGSGWSLRQMFASVVNYVKSRLYFDTLDGEVEIDTTTGMPKNLKGRLTFSNPSMSDRKKGLIAIDDLLQHCNNSLVAEGKQVWFLVDRLVFHA